jgi:peptidoglycan/xylan/chitin deacetylase (PgdA/CDA1 family)
MRAVGWAATTMATSAAVYRLGFSPTSQLLGEFPYRGTDAGRDIALTFDDGPNEPFTSQLLGVLATRNVPATFFQVGRCVQRHPGLTRAMVASGHVIGNHSFSHRLTSYVREPSFRQEIARTQQILTAEIGALPGLFRPPWLHRQPWLLAAVRAAGMQIVSGQFGHPLEVLQPGALRIAQHTISIARAGSILILHDGFDARGGYRGETVAAVGHIIDELQAAQFRFVTVDQLLGVPAYQRRQVISQTDH